MFLILNIYFTILLLYNYIHVQCTLIKHSSRIREGWFEQSNYFLQKLHAQVMVENVDLRNSNDKA